MPHVVSFQMLSFVLSREVPVLFQKVSRLLALIHVVSASRKNLPSLSPCKGLSENYWAAYFHQASVGVYHNLQLLSAISVKHRSQMVSKNKGYEAAVETSMIEDMCTLLRMAPKSTEEIESYVAKFFEKLPSVTIVCMSLLGASYEKARIPKLFLEKGCYIGSVIDCDRGRSSSLDKAHDAVDYLSDSLIAAVNKVELEYCTRREPVVFVLDSDVQMLPLENMPIMREQEVYRMPSVTSIFMALQRRSVQEEDAGIATKFPLIDPLDAFYLLNPSGELSRTQTEFEEFFKHQNMQGMAGIVPSTEELSSALENRDLFLYFGHGSGAQYIPREKIQKLESCAAMLLMGCSSGSLNLNGCYAPVGTSLSYLLAGAPIVVANLWEVTDLDIDRFAKAMLKSFLEERSMFSTGCIQCSLLA